MRMCLVRYFLASTVIFCLATFAFGAAVLTKDEVQVLSDIAKTLGKTDWNFSVDPCSAQSGWIYVDELVENNVTCNCSFSNGTQCHVVSISLKGQNLPGTLPVDFIKLPYLQEIDLTRNYLNGSIPPEWGSTQLVNISLSANRLTGSLPKELANIKTLKSLTLESNQLSGNLPPELGDMLSIERFFLSSNYFTGELPDSFAKLTNLKDFRISDNQLSGNIPNYIQEWTTLEKLVIQASGLNSPIPPGIARLGKLSDLRISDLNVSEQPFPSLNATKLKILILRNCNITGQLPEFLGDMTSLKSIDLSFNKLSGGIPSNFAKIQETDFIYLTNNLLTGEVPDWMLNKGGNIDLSYNKFTVGKSGPSSCQQRVVNMFASSLGDNDSGVVSCLKNFRCPKNWYNLHINCGGEQVAANGSSVFEGDTNPGGPSLFLRGGENWGFSSTGHFMDDSTQFDSYIQQSSSKIPTTNPELYMNARLSPLSLTYYAFCLGNGNYRVNLHFAEIRFTDDEKYSSLGRRIFDVYIQGELVWKDFNIAKEAGGVGKAIIKSSNAVVSKNTLEIRLYWAGKGSTTIPDRGVYGPLISAISVDPAS